MTSLNIEKASRVFHKGTQIRKSHETNETPRV